MIMKKLPEFKTQDEEIKFWEKHSIADYWMNSKRAKTFSKDQNLPRSH